MLYTYRILIRNLSNFLTGNSKTIVATITQVNNHLCYEFLIGEGNMSEISLTINGKVENHDVADNTLLVDFIRESVGLTGTHVGCDTSQC